MSRSKKKTPWAGDDKGREAKRTANKTVRARLREEDEALPQGGAFKKYYESWEICDYGRVSTWEEYKKFRINFVFGGREDLFNEARERKSWEKNFVRK